MRLTAEVLGPIRLVADGAPVDLGGPRQRRLFGVLVMQRGSVVSTDRLIDAVFANDPPEGARRTFRTYVARLRRALDVAGVDAASVIVTEANGYAIPESAMDLDSALFEEALADGHDRLAAGDADGAALGLDEALALWSGPAYVEFADETWASVEAIRLAALRTLAREYRAEAVLESGRHAAIIPDIEALMDEEPFREEPCRLLMLALYRSGRHADALRAGRAYRRLLADETGLEASRQLTELEQLIVDQDPRLEARPRGRKLRGYLLGPPIAETELGVTYRATQPSVDREVAITVISPERADDPMFIRRFEVYAQRIASIDHVNIVPLYDFWREPGAAYLVTRFLAGGSLARRMTERVMTDDERMSIVREIGAALTAAHERGILHGQLTPSSVLFDGAGTAYLNGFGLDADPRSKPTDIAALGELATQLWAESKDAANRTQARTAMISRVQSIAERARDARTDPPFGSVAELVSAIEAASVGDVGAPQSPTSATIEGPNPYRGLFAFAETDAEVFFGRELLVEAMLADLSAHPFLAVIGPSGSGKSSVVRAGLLPQLRSTGAFIATMVPGERPLAELEIAISRVASRPVPDLSEAFENDPSALGAVLADVLPEPGRELVLLIDQFEEAFTLAAPHERDLLVEVIGRALEDPAVALRVVITARADFLGPILDHATIGVAVRDHSRLVTPLSPDELHAAIVGPAESVGVAVESALATALVSDVVRSQGSLPLLQFSLTELYERRADGTMTLGAYRHLGGIGAVLSQRAEEIFSSLDVDERAASRRLFSRLILPGEGVEDTRRRAKQSELVGISTKLIGAYGRARLVSFDRDPLTREPTVEIAHEALIRRWPRLQGWIDEDRDGMRVLSRLTASASEWEASDRDESQLYRGARLATVDEWAEEHRSDLSPAERSFLDSSRAQRDVEALLERRHLQRLRILLGTVAVIAAVAVVAGSIAVVQRRRADTSAGEADLRRVMAESQVAVGEDPNRALLLALEAYRLAPSTETLGSLQAAVTGSRTDWLGDVANGTRYRRVAFISDEALVASSQHRIEVWDVIDRVMLRERAIGAAITDIDVSVDGALVAAAGADGSWTILEASNLAQVTGGVADRGITVIRVDAEHGVVALGLDDGRVQIERIDGPGPSTILQPAAEDNPVAEAVTDISLSPDGRRVAAAWGIGRVAQQWDLRSGATVGRALSTDHSAQLVLYADDVLYSAADRLQSFEPDSGAPIDEASVIPGGVDGDMRLVANELGLQIVGLGSVWTLGGQGGDATPVFYEGVSTAFGGAVSPGGGLLAFGTTNGLTFWAPDGVGLFIDATVPAAAEVRQFSAISNDGRIVVQGGNIRDEVPTTIWTMTETGPVLVAELASGVGVRQFGSDVMTFEATDDGLSFKLWNESTGSLEQLMVADFATFGVNIPALTPDRRQFLHPWNGGEGILDIYDVASGRLLHRLRDVEDAAPPLTSHSSVPEFSTDGRRLVYPTASEYVAVYDADTWTLLDLLDPSDGFAHVVFTPDGTHAITLSSRGLEIRDAADLRTVVLGPVPSVDDPSLGRVLELTVGGEYLKTGGLEGAQLWDAATLEPIGRPFPHDREAWAATLATETDQLATVVDGATVLWQIELERWPELSCFAVGRNLTRQEWAEFGPRGPYHATCDNWPEG